MQSSKKNSASDRGMDKDVYTVEYYSTIKRNETGSFVEMWIDLEFFVQSEVSQKEGKKGILTHMWGI